MDEREKLLRKRAAKSRNTDTGDLDYEEVYDTGINHLLWGWPCKRKAKKVVTDCGDGE